MHTMLRRLRGVAGLGLFTGAAWAACAALGLARRGERLPAAAAMPELGPGAR